MVSAFRVPFNAVGRSWLSRCEQPPSCTGRLDAAWDALNRRDSASPGAARRVPPPTSMDAGASSGQEFRFGLLPPAATVRRQSWVDVRSLRMSSSKTPSEFERAASQEGRTGLIAETWAFLRENKKWWLLPILLVLVAFGILVVVSGTAGAPFIYTLF